MKPLKKLTFMHVLLIVLAIGVMIRLDDFAARIAIAADDKSEKVDAKVADAPEKKDDKDKKSKDEKAKADDKADHKAEPVVEDATASEPPIDDLSNADMGVLQQLSERRRQLDLREKEMDQRDALLQAAQVELGKKYKELDGLRAEIKRLLDQQSQEEEARLVSLVKVYEGMKPAEAANILNTLDTGVLMQVMGRMSERKMSPILANMNPDRAREVTIRLAKQKTLPEASADPSPAASAPPPAAATNAAPANVPPKP